MFGATDKARFICLLAFVAIIAPDFLPLLCQFVFDKPHVAEALGNSVIGGFAPFQFNDEEGLFVLAYGKDVNPPSRVCGVLLALLPLLVFENVKVFGKDRIPQSPPATRPRRLRPCGYGVGYTRPISENTFHARAF